MSAYTTYKSYTHGPISLSVEAHNLMQALHSAITDAIRHGDYSAKNHAVARARGELAQYMSRLENSSAFRTHKPIYGFDRYGFGLNKPTLVEALNQHDYGPAMLRDCGPRLMIEADIGWESLTPEQSHIRTLERTVARLQKRLKRARK